MTTGRINQVAIEVDEHSYMTQMPKHSYLSALPLQPAHLRVGQFRDSKFLTKISLAPHSFTKFHYSQHPSMTTSDNSLAPITVNCLNSFQSSAPYRRFP